MAEEPKPLIRFGQCFGDLATEDDNNEADVLSTVRFDETGDYLATGDKGGRVVVFVRSDAGRGRHNSRKRPHSAVASEGGDRGGSTGVGGSSSGAEGGGGSSSSRGLPAGELQRTHGRPVGVPGPSSAEYQFYAEFQSHTAEFDCLKSAEIEEKINKIAWCKQATDSLLLLTTNDRSIKLWKVHERTERAPAFRNVELGQYGGHLPVRELRVPPLSAGEPAVHISSRRLFSTTAHTYDINSLSTCSDAATFLSSDDLRINLWSLDNPRLCFNVVDLKPSSAEDVMELIYSAKFHPISCSLFAYSTSRGSLRVGDTRASALCDAGAKSYGNPMADTGEGGSSKSYIGQTISALTGLEFSGDGRFVLARDYMSVKMWDLAMDREPVAVMPVQEGLRSYLPSLYENDSIFDKFQVASSYDGSRVMTGGYNATFKMFDVRRGTETTGDLLRNKDGMVSAPTVGRVPATPPLGWHSLGEGGEEPPVPGEPWLKEHVRRKVLHFCWHPFEECVAVAGRSSLFIYNGV